jgi:hypothetical protein
MKTKIYRILSGAKEGLFALAWVVLPGTVCSQATYTFNYTGAIQTLTVPGGIYDIKMWGADGGNSGNSRAGIGGYSNGTLTVGSATTLYIGVGGAPAYTGVTGLQPGGYNGGGSGYANSTGRAGGGASHVATANGTLGALASNTAAVIIVAGGGGGDQNAGLIGHGGGSTGGGTYPGTQTGSAGGIFGAFGQGGDITTSYGGGGGGGWYGGGGNQNNAGSGGSGYIGGVSNGVTSMSASTGFVTKPIVSGNGLVLITELCSIDLYAAGNTNSLNPILCSGQSATLMTNAIGNYSWSTGATTSSLVVSPTSNTVYVLTAMSPSNCTTSRSISVTVNSGPPVLSISNPSSNICLGKTVSLTASGAITYTWANPGIVNGQTFTPTSTAVYTVSGQNGCGTTVSTTTITVAPLVVSVLATPTIVCQGYTATLTAVAAVNGFTWQPNNAMTAITVVAPYANTVYTVTASDGTCSGTATLALAIKPTPTITTSATSTNICEGELSVLTASGASTYTWNPGNLTGSMVTVSPISPTLYVVNGTNSFGCESSAQQIVLVMAAPPTTVAADKTLTCTGSAIILSAGGAATYSWTSGPPSSSYTVFPTGPAVYTVTGFGSNGCPKSQTISVDAVIPNVTVPATVAVCSGKSTTITASGATTYSWNGISSSSASYATVPLTSNTVVVLTAKTSSSTVNCFTSHTINVTVNPNPTVNVAATRTTVCPNQSSTLTATGALTYDWGALGTTTSIVVSPTVQTTYTVAGVDANGCKGIGSFVVKTSLCLGIAEMNSAAVVLSVYPNPNDGSFTISAASAIKLRLVNELGQQLMVFDLNVENKYKADVEGISNGVYFIIGQNETGIVNQKVVITK